MYFNQIIVILLSEVEIHEIFLELKKILEYHKQKALFFILKILKQVMKSKQ